MNRSLTRLAVLGVFVGIGLLALASFAPQAVADSEVPALPAQDVAETSSAVDDVEANVTFLQPASQQAKRSWGPEQAAGPPDTEGAGDFVTAWASLTADGQKEWLICEYAEAMLPTAVVVHANDAPGSLEKVSVFDEAGKEHEVWTGTDPTPRTSARGTSVIPIKSEFKVKKIKVYLDSPAVPGWNEIDAVGLRSKDNTQWAETVTASTTYAAGFQPLTVSISADQLRNLEGEVKALKTEIQQMNSDIKELKELVKALKEDK